MLVDYAHTPDSLENVLRAARLLTDGRLICVFGCGGDRDRFKRPLMGRAGSELADLAVVTSDNPRSEDPGAIIAMVLDGVSVDRRPCLEVEPDRRAAIALALSRAEPGDLVVIAGKGHEQGQEFEGGRKVPFDDREVAREELQRLAAGDGRQRDRARRRADRRRDRRPPRTAPTTGRGRRVPSSIPARSGRAICSSASPARTATAGEFAARGARAGRLGRRRRRRARRWARGPRLRRRRPAGGAAVAGPRLAARDRLPDRRDHRLDRQDLGQGHLPGAPAAPRPRQPRELQHRDRHAAGDPGGAARRRSCW